MTAPLFLPSDLADPGERRRWTEAVAVRWRRVWGPNDRDDQLLRAAWQADPRHGTLSLAAFAFECLERAAWVAWAERGACGTWRVRNERRHDVVPWRDFSAPERVQWLASRTIYHALTDLRAGAVAAAAGAEWVVVAGAEPPVMPDVFATFDPDDCQALRVWIAADGVRHPKRALRSLRLLELVDLTIEEPEAWRDGLTGIDDRMGWPAHTTRDLLTYLPGMLRGFADGRTASPTSAP